MVLMGERADLNIRVWDGWLKVAPAALSTVQNAGWAAALSG